MLGKRSTRASHADTDDALDERSGTGASSSSRDAAVRTTTTDGPSGESAAPGAPRPATRSFMAMNPLVDWSEFYKFDVMVDVSSYQNTPRQLNTLKNYLEDYRRPLCIMLPRTWMNWRRRSHRFENDALTYLPVNTLIFVVCVPYLINQRYYEYIYSENMWKTSPT